MCSCVFSLLHGALLDSAEIREIRMGHLLTPRAMMARMPRIPAFAEKYALPEGKKWLPFGETRIIRGVKNH